MKIFLLRFWGVVVALVAAANFAVAADIPMRIDWAMNRSTYTFTGIYVGVCGDAPAPSNPCDPYVATYVNGVSGMQVYLGTGGKNVVLFTKGTGRKLFLDGSKLPGNIYIPGPDNEKYRWSIQAGLPPTVLSEVVAYAQTKVGYKNIQPGAWVKATGQVQFQYNNNTYNLRYTDLAVKNIGTNRWLITSDPTEVVGATSATVWMRAILSILRNGGHEDFGWVGMPIRFEATTNLP